MVYISIIGLSIESVEILEIPEKFQKFQLRKIIMIYSKTSLCGHLSKVETSVLWTPFGSPKLFLLEMNLLNVDTSLFWTVDTFFRSRLQ